MELFWFVLGAAVVALSYVFNRFFKKRDRAPAWYDWLAYIALVSYWSFVLYFVFTSFGEQQAKAAGVGFTIFGGIGLLLVLAYRLLLVRRFRQV